MLSLLLCLFVIEAFGQNKPREKNFRGAESGILFGPVFALTDIGGAFEESPMTFISNQLKAGNMHAGIFHRQRISKNIGLVASFSTAQVSDADSLAPAGSTRPLRELSFSNRLYEAGLGVEFHYPLPSSKIPASLYAFIGFVIFHHDPVLYKDQAIVSNGNQFSKTQVGLPLGVGLQFMTGAHWKIGFSAGWRKLFFDYLDNYTSSSSKYNDGYFFNSFSIGYFLPDLSDKKAILCSPFH